MSSFAVAPYDGLCPSKPKPSINMKIELPVKVTEPCVNALEIKDDQGQVICSFDCEGDYIDEETRKKADFVADAVNAYLA